MAKGTSSPRDFWKYLEAWGGTWMWKGINAAQTIKSYLTWLVEGMKSNTLVWVTDGLYDQKRAADLNGAGWIIFCNKMRLRLTGTFWEWSLAASSSGQKCLAYAPCTFLPESFLEFHKI